MKLFVIWPRPPQWWTWLLLPFVIALTLPLQLLYLPYYFGILVAWVHWWAQGKRHKALWESPVNPLKIQIFWWIIGITARIWVMGIWYSRALNWAFVKLRLTRQSSG